MREYFQGKDIYFYPFAFACFPLFSLYVNNADKLHFQEVVSVGLLVLILTAVLLRILTRVVHQPHKAALLASMFWLVFFSYEHVINAVGYILISFGLFEKMHILLRGDLADIFWLSLWGILLLLMIFSVLKYRKDLAFVARLFNVLGVGVLGAVFLNWGLVNFRQPHDEIKNYIRGWQQYVAAESLVESAPQPDQLPDIYYIIMDGLGRADVLEEYYQVDTHAFTAALEDMGFYIADASYANYHWTLFSIASSLNFMYLDDLTAAMGPDTLSLTPPEAMIENNRLFAQLKLQGYQIVTFADSYAPIDITSGDVYLSPSRWMLNAFQNEVFNTTPLPALFRALALRSSYDLHREQVLFAFDHLADVSSNEGPKLVFAHIIAPHPPFVLDAQGNAVRPTYNFSLLDGSQFQESASREDYIDGYRQQTTYVLERLRVEVERILAQSERPVVMLIQADHGPGAYWDIRSAANTDLHERMAIFNAYYFPDGNYAALYPEITPVNSFRVVLNTYLNTTLELLPDRSYFFSLTNPYLMMDVMDELDD